jgi:hypothetical protein
MTKKELLSLLAEAETLLWAAGSQGFKDGEALRERIENALRAEYASTPGGVCVTCGETLAQSSTGRPRMYCGEACKKRAYRAKSEQRGAGS